MGPGLIRQCGNTNAESGARLSQQKQIDKFYAYLDELDQSYGRLADLLRQKLVAVDKFNIAKLEEVMKEEQVYVLLSRGFENNIRAHRDKLGLAGGTLGEIIEELPQEERPRFQSQLGRFRATLESVRALNERCQSLIETRLYTIDKSIREIDKSEGVTYQKGEKPKPPAPDGPRFFTKSV